MRRKLFYLSVALLAVGICFEIQSADAQTYNNVESAKSEIPCQDKNLSLVWDKIKGEFETESLAGLNERGIHDCSGLVELEKVVDLNDDRQAEIIAHQTADCPASGNCMFWVFQKKNDEYQAILDADEIQLFELKKLKTNGYTDIQLRTHNSATSHYFQLFKYNGEKYTARKCWWEDYSYEDKKGNIHETKKPIIHFEKCGEYDYVN